MHSPAKLTQDGYTNTVNMFTPAPLKPLYNHSAAIIKSGKTHLTEQMRGCHNRLAACKLSPAMFKNLNQHTVRNRLFQGAGC
jgi:hypothetical protein